MMSDTQIAKVIHRECATMPEAERCEECKSHQDHGVPKSVPRIATPEMRAIFRQAYREGGFWSDRLDYALDQMLAAAPQATNAAEKRLQWPAACDVGRLHDMSPAGHLRVGFDADNDVFVEVFNDEMQTVASVEFCNPGGGGGGRSTRTRTALIALMVAMEADNAERPDLDWWALRGVKPNGARGGM